MGQVLLDSELINQIYSDYENKYRSVEIGPYGKPYPRSQRITKKEIKEVLVCRAKSDFRPIYGSDLYRNRSGAYTRLLYLIECRLNGRQVLLKPIRFGV